MKASAATTLTGLGLAWLALAGCAAPHACYRDSGYNGPPAPAPAVEGVGMADCAACGPEATPSDPCNAPVLFPGRPLRNLLHGLVTRGAGCGPVYWSEWHYDRPEPCDPCNNYGDYVGPRSCGPSCWQKLWQGIHGARCGADLRVDEACIEKSYAVGCDVPAGGGPGVEAQSYYNDSVSQPSVLWEEESSGWDEFSTPSPGAPPQKGTSPPTEQIIPKPEPEPEDQSAAQLQPRSRLSSRQAERSCLVNPGNR